MYALHGRECGNILYIVEPCKSFQSLLPFFFFFFFAPFPNPHLFCWYANIWGLFFIMSFCLWGCLFLRVHELADNEKVTTIRPGNILRIKQKPGKPLTLLVRVRRTQESRHNGYGCYWGGSPWWLKKLPRRGYHWVLESHHSHWHSLQNGLNKVTLCGKQFYFAKKESK